MNPETLERTTIFLTLAGSQAHGTAQEGSDIDLRGVCVVPLRERLSLFTSFEQYDGPLSDAQLEHITPALRAHPTAAAALDLKLESVVYDVAKFLKLCAAANPNMLEILFADERDWLFSTPAWCALYAQRHRFLTRRVQHTFLGYALAQLKRIKTHRSWLLQPPGERPRRERFGLPSSRSTLSRDHQSRLEKSIQLDPNTEFEMPAEVVATLRAEQRYRSAMTKWESYQKWKRSRNPVRAALEKRFGYDTKHAAHLVRLMRMGLEALETGELRVRREDAEELRAIREGALSFEALLTSADGLKDAIKTAAERTALPPDIDPEEVDRLAAELMLS